MNQQTEGKEEITQGGRRKLVDIILDFFTCCCCCCSCGCVSIIKSIGGLCNPEIVQLRDRERERKRKEGKSNLRLLFGLKQEEIYLIAISILYNCC